MVWREGGWGACHFSAPLASTQWGEWERRGLQMRARCGGRSCGGKGKGRRIWYDMIESAKTNMYKQNSFTHPYHTSRTCPFPPSCTGQRCRRKDDKWWVALPSTSPTPLAPTGALHPSPPSPGQRAPRGEGKKSGWHASPCGGRRGTGQAGKVGRAGEGETARLHMGKGERAK
jgi:hypothetical protein